MLMLCDQRLLGCLTEVSPMISLIYVSFPRVVGVRTKHRGDRSRRQSTTVPTMGRTSGTYAWPTGGLRAACFVMTGVPRCTLRSGRQDRHAVAIQKEVDAKARQFSDSSRRQPLLLRHSTRRHRQSANGTQRTVGVRVYLSARLACSATGLHNGRVTRLDVVSVVRASAPWGSSNSRSSTRPVSSGSG